MYINEWLTLLVKWFHVIAGIAWIGASFYFIWLDNSLQAPPKWKKDKGIKGDLWAIHGGGFYEVAKYQYGPETMPSTLHWFKWEAYSTWISGMLLLVMVYYLNASAFLIDPAVAALTPTQSIFAGVTFIVAGFLLYELLCRSPLNRNETLLNLTIGLLICLSVYLACQLFSGRGAYIHVGSLIGTIMAANVFVKIIPSQRKLVHAVANKQDIDPVWGLEAKQRSVHNNYFTLPLIFIMISNHYPLTYQHPLNWVLLIGIALIAAWVRHFFNLKHQGIFRPSILITAAIASLGLIAFAQMTDGRENVTSVEAEVSVTTQDVMAVINQHCSTCHATLPTDEMFKVAPLGVVFDDYDSVTRQAAQIYQRTVITRDMPFMNKTNMSDEERRIIKVWYEQLSN